MPGADVCERRGVRLVFELVQRVAAEEHEGARLLQLVPESFEAEHGVGVALGPEERDHLAEGAHAPPARRSALDESADDLGEEFGRRRRAVHQFCKRLRRDVLPRVARLLHVQPEIQQPRLKPVAVLARRHDDAGVAFGESDADVAGERVEEKLVRLVELHEVLGRAHLAPIEARREFAGANAVAAAVKLLADGAALFHCLYQKSLPAGGLRQRGLRRDCRRASLSYVRGNKLCAGILPAS